MGQFWHYVNKLILMSPPAYPQIIRKIVVPTLVIQGKKDPYIPLAQAQHLQQDIPNAQLNIIPDGGHFLPLDTPEQVAHAINEFLAS